MHSTQNSKPNVERRGDNHSPGLNPSSNLSSVTPHLGQRKCVNEEPVRWQRHARPRALSEKQPEIIADAVVRNQHHPMARIGSTGLINELEHLLHGHGKRGLALDILILDPYSQMWTGVDSSGQVWKERSEASLPRGLALDVLVLYPYVPVQAAGVDFRCGDWEARSTPHTVHTSHTTGHFRIPTPNKSRNPCANATVPSPVYRPWIRLSKQSGSMRCSGSTKVL